RSSAVMFQRSAGSWVPQPYQPERSLPLKRAVKPGGGTLLSAARAGAAAAARRGSRRDAFIMLGGGSRAGDRDSFRAGGRQKRNCPGEAFPLEPPALRMKNESPTAPAPDMKLFWACFIALVATSFVFGVRSTLIGDIAR